VSSSPEPSRVEAELELTEQDVRHALQSMPERRYGALALYVFAGLTLAGFGLVQGFDPAFGLSMALVVVLLVGTNLVSTRLQARRFINEIAAERRRTTYVFTPSALEIKNKTSQSRQDYEGLKRYVLTPHTLLLYSSTSIGQIVPLRAFAPADRERVVGWVKARVKPSPKLPNALGRTLGLWAVLVVSFGAIWWFLNP